MKRLMVFAALVAAGCASEPPAGADVPEAYAVQLAVTPVPGNGAQRVALPAAALVALRAPDGGDVRVFDRSGRSMAMALEGDGSEASAVSSLQEVAATPIKDASATEGGNRVSVRIEQSGQAVGIDSGGASAAAPGEAVLLDTRSIERPVDALFIRADLPKYVAVTIAIEASADLKAWEPLGEKVLYRTSDIASSPDVLASSRYALQGADLRGRYLKLSWAAAPGVTVTGARVATTAARPQPRITLPTKGAALVTAHELAFSVDFSTRLAAIRLTETAPDGPVPITLYGRDRADQPWSTLARGVVRQENKPVDLELSGAGFAAYKLVADARTSGFSSPPRLDLMVEPVTVLAVFNGQPPYRLAIGNASAKSRFLSVQEIAGSTEAALSLPTAKVDLAPAQAIDVAPAKGDRTGTNRQLILWLVLLLGTAVLAFAVWRLMRGNAAAPQGQ